jgi:predicted nuclease of predicted toxin-antitoxin system
VTVWLDAQLSPHLADWLSRRFGINAIAVRHLQLRDASDQDIFNAARAANAVVLTKDSDFVRLLERHGPPPRVVWLTSATVAGDFPFDTHEDRGTCRRGRLAIAVSTFV